MPSVRACRHALGLPWPYPAVRPWTPQEEEVLGKYSDKEAAKHLGRSVMAVYLHRRILKLPPAASTA
jgi:hypothetical protein